MASTDELIERVRKYAPWLTAVEAGCGLLTSFVSVVLTRAPSYALEQTLGKSARLINGPRAVADTALSDVTAFWVVVARGIMAKPPSALVVLAALALALFCFASFQRWLGSRSRPRLDIGLRSAAIVAFLGFGLHQYPRFAAGAELRDIAVASAAPAAFHTQGGFANWFNDSTRIEAARLYALFHGVDGDRPLDSSNRCQASQRHLERVGEHFGSLATRTVSGFFVLVALTLYVVSGVRVFRSVKRVRAQRTLLVLGAGGLLLTTALQLAQWWWLLSGYGHLHASAEFLKAALPGYRDSPGEHIDHWPFCGPSLGEITDEALYVRNVWPLGKTFKTGWLITDLAHAPDGRCKPKEDMHECVFELRTGELEGVQDITRPLRHPWGLDRLRTELRNAGVRGAKTSVLASVTIDDGQCGGEFVMPRPLPLGLP
jgi:hypothetical protein